MIEMPFSSTLLIEECEKRGIQVERYKSSAMVKLKYKKHTEYLWTYIQSRTTSAARFICENKNLTKDILSEAGLSVCRGVVFNSEHLEEAAKYMADNLPIFFKPVNAMGGEHAYRIDEIKQFNRIWKKLNPNPKQKFIVENFFDGGEYRILASADKYMACAQRVPAHVIGDGVSVLKTLILEKNKILRKPIQIDKYLIARLRSKKKSLKYRPEDGEIVYLRDNSNISTGGTSEDWTEKVHPSVRKIAMKAIASIPGLFYGGVDIMTKDITKLNKPGDYAILEINENPGLGVHHFPNVGKPKDAAKEIIDLTFPETIGK